MVMMMVMMMMMMVMMMMVTMMMMIRPVRESPSFNLTPASCNTDLIQIIDDYEYDFHHEYDYDYDYDKCSHIYDR